MNLLIQIIKYFRLKSLDHISDEEKKNLIYQSIVKK